MRATTTKPNLTTRRIYRAGWIGCGTMGSVLASAAAKSVGGEQILTADHHPDRLERLHRQYGTIPATTQDVAQKSRFIFIGVKPQVIANLADEIRETLAYRRQLQEEFILVTMAAGIPIHTISDLLGECPIIRIMPNMPAAVGEGVIPYCTDGISPEQESDFLELMRPAGMFTKLDESKIDMACAVTGCGPAFACVFLEAMIDGAVRCGLSREVATQFSLQTVIGTAKLALESGRNPAALRADVCSPAGSTIEGIAALESRAFRFAVMDAIEASYRRTIELSKKN